MSQHRSQQRHFWIEANLGTLKALNTVQKGGASSFDGWLFQEGEQLYVTDLQTKLAATLSSSQKLSRQQLAQMRSGSFCARINLKQFLYSAMINFLTKQPYLFILIKDYSVVGAELVDYAKTRLFDPDKLATGQHELVDKQFGRILKPKSRTSISNLNNTTQNGSPRAATTTTTTSSIKTRSSISRTPKAQARDESTEDASCNENLSILVGQLSSMDSLQDYTIEIVDKPDAKEKRSPSKKKPANLNEAFVKTAQSLLAQETLLSDDKSSSKDDDLLLLDEDDSIERSKNQSVSPSKMATRASARIGGVKLSTQLAADLPQFDHSAIQSLSHLSSSVPEPASPGKRKRDHTVSSIQITRLNRPSQAARSVTSTQLDNTSHLLNGGAGSSHFESTQNENGLISQAQSQLISQVSPIKVNNTTAAVAGDESQPSSTFLEPTSQASLHPNLVIKETILNEEHDESTKLTPSAGRHLAPEGGAAAGFRQMTPLKISLGGESRSQGRPLVRSLLSLNNAGRTPLKRTDRCGSVMSNCSAYTDSILTAVYDNNHLSSPSSIYLKRKRRLLQEHKASDDFQRSELKLLARERLGSQTPVKTKRTTEDETMDADNEEENEDGIISDDESNPDGIMSEDENNEDETDAASEDAVVKKTKGFSTKSGVHYNLRKSASSSSSSSSVSSAFSTSAQSTSSSSFTTSFLTPPVHKSLIFAPKISYSEHKPLSSIARAHYPRVHSSASSVKKTRCSELFKPSSRAAKLLKEQEIRNKVVSAIANGRRDSDLPESTAAGKESGLNLTRTNSLVLDRLISLGTEDDDDKSRSALEKEKGRRRLFNPNSYNIDGAFDSGEAGAVQRPGVLTLRKELDGNIVNATTATRDVLTTTPSKSASQASLLASPLVKKGPTLGDVHLNQFYKKLLVNETAASSPSSSTSAHSTQPAPASNASNASNATDTSSSSNKEPTSDTSSLLLQISAERSIPPGQNPNVSAMTSHSSSKSSAESLESATEHPCISLESALISYSFKLNPDSLQEYLIESKASN